MPSWKQNAFWNWISHCFCVVIAGKASATTRSTTCWQPARKRPRNPATERSKRRKERKLNPRPEEPEWTNKQKQLLWRKKNEPSTHYLSLDPTVYSLDDFPIPRHCNPSRMCPCNLFYNSSSVASRVTRRRTSCTDIQTATTHTHTPTNQQQQQKKPCIFPSFSVSIVQFFLCFPARDYFLKNCRKKKTK